jgi:hypothetical protein
VGCDLGDLLQPPLQAVGRLTADLVKVASIWHHFGITFSNHFNAAVESMGASINGLWIAIMNGLQHRS